MSYGIQFLNDNGDKVVDETNEVMLVAEKGSADTVRSTIFGAGDSVNNNYAGEWIRVTHDGTASGRTKFYFTNIVLSSQYSEKPILALRGVNGSSSILPRAYVRKHNSTSYNAIRIIARQPLFVDWILLAKASQCPSTSKDVTGYDYGVQILDDSVSQATLLDTRWPEIFSVRDSVNFPQLSTANYVDNGVPVTSVTIAECPAGFFSVDTIYGHHSVVEQVEQEQEFGAPLLLFGGGEFYPTVRQVSNTSIQCTMVNTEEGASQSSDGGDVLINSTFQHTGGDVLVIRYINF